MTAKRDTFQELMEGVKAMRLHREGKITLRTHVYSMDTLEPIPSLFTRNSSRKIKHKSKSFA